MDTTIRQAVQQTGRAISESLLKTAIKKATDKEEMGLHIGALRMAAISLLAHEAYNRNEQMGQSLNDFMIQLMQELREECELLVNAPECEVFKCGQANR
jgi:hypothetical protein